MNASWSVGHEAPLVLPGLRPRRDIRQGEREAEGEKMNIGRDWQILCGWSFAFGKRGWPPPGEARVKTTAFPKGIIFYSYHFGPIEFRKYLFKEACSRLFAAREEDEFLNGTGRP
jgi:hypothetical protein